MHAIASSEGRHTEAVTSRRVQGIAAVGSVKIPRGPKRRSKTKSTAASIEAWKGGHAASNTPGSPTGIRWPGPIGASEGTS